MPWWVIMCSKAFTLRGCFAGALPNHRVGLVVGVGTAMTLGYPPAMRCRSAWEAENWTSLISSKGKPIRSSSRATCFSLSPS